MLSFVRRLRASRLRSALKDQEAFYSHVWKPAESRDWQLEQFNEQWAMICRHVPYYSRLAKTGEVPGRFQSWAEFQSTVPVTDRKLVQGQHSALWDESRPADFVRTTGGSTSEPVQLPAWNSELAYANSDVWFARSWFGIEPSDKLFLLWGHSHQLGEGVKGRINAMRREMKDALLGYHRCSAYDLSHTALRRAGEEMLRIHPAWIVAYSVALDRFTRVNADRTTEFRALNLKAAIATAEAFPRNDSEAFIAGVLGCPVIMEYGSVECGPVAHQRLVPTALDPPVAARSPFQIFWRHWFVEGTASPYVPGAFEIYLTSLYPRCFPIVRYRIGDLISEDPNAAAFDQTFERVIGRCNDCIELPDGTMVHSEAFTHAVKECASVLSFQVVQKQSGGIRFDYVANGTECAADVAEIRRRLQMINPALDGIALTQVDRIEQTVAGKTRPIRKE